jgi:hypothetical protein
MSPTQPPYFFPEAMRVGWKALDRERQLNIDSKDIEFLRKVFFASDAERRQQSPPMIAQRIWLNKSATDAVELAGSFMMSSTSAYPHAWLYTPYGGLEKFDSPALVLTALKERLKKPADATQLLCFLPLQQQASQVLDNSLVLTSEVMLDDVFDEQEKTLRLYQGKNRQALLTELKQLPTLGSLLSKLLESICRPLFPGLAPSEARVSFFARQSAVHTAPRWLDSLQLNDAVLLYYREQAWPAGQTHKFFHPKRPADAKEPGRKAGDTQRWESAIKQAAGQLIPYLHSALETFWNTEITPGVSRRAWFARAMAANARLDLLFKRQQSIISPEQSQALAALYEPDGKAALQNGHVLRFEKVLVWEHSTNVVELASSLMIGNSQTFLYIPDKGLQVLGSYDDLMETLKAMVKAPGYEDDLYNLMSLEERALFVGFKAPQFSGNPIAGNLFEHLFEAIISKQQHNLRYALDLYRRTRAGIEPSALVDHALDVRYMIDSHLPALDTAGRWTPHSVLADPTRPVSLTAERAALLKKQLLDIRDTLTAQVRAQPTLANTVNQALTSEFSRRGLAGQDPGKIFINRYTASSTHATAPLESQSLCSYFLARLIHGHGPIADTPDYGLYDGQGSGLAKKLTGLDIPQANAILDAMLIRFHNYDIADIPREHLEQLKAPMAHAMAVAIQGEASLRRRNGSLDARDEAIVQTVFDLQHPDRRQRQGLGGFIPDAYALTVEPQGLAQRVPLAHCLMLTERGGLDPSHSGRAILWTPARGLESFANVSQLQAELKRRLAAPNLRMQLLANLDPSCLKPHQSCPLGHFMQINGAVAQHSQQSWIDHYRAQRAHCLALKLSSDALLNRFGELEKALPANNLSHAAQIAQTLIAQQSLPAWMGMASVVQQRRHVEILDQYRHNLLDDKDYLDDVPPLRQYVSGKLEALLKDYDVLPQDVYILPKLVLAGQRQNLVDYALNHISQQAAEFDVESTATALTPTIVRQILVRLPLKQDNTACLAEKFTPGKPGAEAREQRFIRQLPWQLLQNAHALRLQELLSPKGLSLIEQVLDMPDAVARAAVKDATSTIRPLELIATAGARTIKALGVYLINAVEKAPLVMYVPYGPQQAFLEFENEAALLHRLNLPGPLQDWVVDRLPEAEQATYRNLWASTLGKTSEITLAANPIKGHALKQLYRDNIDLISSLFEQQTHANGRSAWDTLKALFSRGLQQAQRLLPGKLMVPLVIWQSYQLFKASAEDLQQHRWRDALETFIGGVAQMASMRKLMDEPPTASAAAVQPALNQTASAWQDIDVTAQTRTRLQTYEANDISLQSLTAGNSGVYTATDNRYYLPCAGKVYRTEQADGHWRLFSGQSKGPFVRLDAERKWTLDPAASVRRHGPGWSAMSSRREVRAVVNREMNVEARGLAEIRRISPRRAQAIVEALDLATFYLNNCQQNLKLLDHKYPPVTRIHRFINRFFGIPADPDTGPPTFPTALSQKLMETITAILDETLKPSLYSLDSTRFVAGTHIADPDQHWAFTIDDDPDRRIYLTENFFTAPTGEFEGHLISYFDRQSHARATTLIHELTHIVSSTADVAYLNSVSPFADLIEVETPAGRDLRERLRDVQENAYSVSTPMGQLFKSMSASSAAGADIGTVPEDDYIKQQVLATTGGVDLSNARGIFKTNLTRRFNTQIDNADSLTLLITTLGRQLDAVPSLAEGTP